jgi:hypothetical protein
LTKRWRLCGATVPGSSGVIATLTSVSPSRGSTTLMAMMIAACPSPVVIERGSDPVGVRVRLAAPASGRSLVARNSGGGAIHR